MNQLHRAVEDYLALRRSLGFKLRDYADCLHEFVSFLEAQESSRVTTKLAVEYATQRQDEDRFSWARRLIMIRGFARYRVGADPRTEIPPPGLLRCRPPRAKPYLYSADEIRRLLEAARNLKTRYPLQRHTYYCLFGLLAVTGLRLGEAISLQPQDVDLSAGVLTVRGAKFGKSRLVPLHPSTRAVLRDYARRRDRFFAGRPIPYFLMTGRGKQLHKTSLSAVFRALSRQIGIRKPGLRHGPRLHDFRHHSEFRIIPSGD